MKQIPVPSRLKIHGRTREIVEITIGDRRWCERLPDGRIVVHVGKLQPAQEPGKILPTAKPCTWCKQPSIIATAGGRAYHPSCPGPHWVNDLPDDMIARITYGVARDLGAEVLEVVEHQPGQYCVRGCCTPLISQPEWRSCRWKIGGGAVR